MSSSLRRSQRHRNSSRDDESRENNGRQRSGRSKRRESRRHKKEKTRDGESALLKHAAFDTHDDTASDEEGSTTGADHNLHDEGTLDALFRSQRSRRVSKLGFGVSKPLF